MEFCLFLKVYIYGSFESPRMTATPCHFIVTILSVGIKADSIMDSITLNVPNSILNIGYNRFTILVKHRFSELGILEVVLNFVSGAFVITFCWLDPHGRRASIKNETELLWTLFLDVFVTSEVKMACVLRILVVAQPNWNIIYFSCILSKIFP